MDLGWNEFEAIEAGTFSEMTKLMELDMRHHLKLSMIRDGAFAGLHNLNRLNLTSNGLNNLTRDSFEGLKKLETLDLSHGQLESLSSDVFDEMATLRVLDLSNNLLRLVACWSIHP